MMTLRLKSLLSGVVSCVCACQPNPEYDGPGASSERVQADLVVLYTFEAGMGLEVLDRAPVTPLVDLVADDPQGVCWEDGVLLVHSGTGLEQRSPPVKLLDRCQEANEVTAEFWIRTADVFPYGQAAVFAWSSGLEDQQRNLSLLQTQPGFDVEPEYEWGLSTSRGEVVFDHPAIPATTRWTHLIMAHSSDGETRLFVDGELHSTVSLAGDLSSWSPEYELTLASPSFFAAWPGWFDLVALYCRALTDDEVAANFAAGRGYEAPVPEL